MEKCFIKDPWGIAMRWGPMAWKVVCALYDSPLIFAINGFEYYDFVYVNSMWSRHGILRWCGEVDGWKRDSWEMRMIRDEWKKNVHS